MSKPSQQDLQRNDGSQKKISFPHSYGQQYFLIKQQMQLTNKMFLQTRQQQFKDALEGGTQQQKIRYRESMEKRVKFLLFKIFNFVYDKIKVTQEQPEKDKKVVYSSPDQHLKAQNQQKMYVLAKAIKKNKSLNAPKPQIGFDLPFDHAKLIQKIPMIKVKYDGQFSQPLEEEYKRVIQKSINIEQKLKDLQFMRNMSQKSMGRLHLRYNSLRLRPGFTDIDRYFNDETM